MKFRVTLLLMLTMLLPVGRLCAQQGVVFSQYLFNGLLINPACAGSKEMVNASVLYRSQWAGLRNTPSTVTLLMDGAVLKNSLGVGGHVISDKVGAQQTLSLFSDYAYRLKIDNQGTRLSLGLSIGVTQLSLDEAIVQVHNPNDPLITSGMLSESVYRPDFNVGVFFDHKMFSAGVSITELWGDYKLVKRTPQLYCTLAGFFPLGRGYTLKPSLMYKDDFKMQPSVDLNAFVIIKSRVGLGASWRNGLPFKSRLNEDLANQRFKTSLNSVAFMAAAFLSDNFYLGYAYEYSLSKLSQLSMGSHEIMLGFTLARKPVRVLSPRYF